MKTLKNVCNHIFIDSLTGMTEGIFVTLILGTILQQAGQVLGGTTGNYISQIGEIAAAFTSAAIGIGIASKYGESVYVTASAAVCGMVGGYAATLSQGAVSLTQETSAVSPGEMLGAFTAAFVGINIGRLISEKTQFDMIITPLITICSGSFVGMAAGRPIATLMTWLCNTINWGVSQRPFIMGIVIAVIMDMAVSLPISTAAIGIILNLDGVAAGAAVIGCCCGMIGFAVTGLRENGAGGLIAQGLGTSKLQLPNIVRHPQICLPTIAASAILGPLNTVLVHMQCNAAGAGMGSSALVGPLMTYQTMTVYMDSKAVIIEILLMMFILPAVISLVISELMRKRGWIKKGQLRLPSRLNRPGMHETATGHTSTSVA